MGHPFGFIAIRTLSYHCMHPRAHTIRIFGTTLSPDHLWREISR